MYRRLARVFPHDFRMICGDGLERLGEDITPLIWRDLGVVGLMRFFADLALHLPLEYLSTWTGKLKEFTIGIKDGQAVAERPTSIIADGRRRPIVDLIGRPIPGVPPGALAFGSRPDAQTIEAGAEVDGKVLAVFERVVPDPYVPQA
jgi:hypothetical protein